MTQQKMQQEVDDAEDWKPLYRVTFQSVATRRLNRSEFKHGDHLQDLRSLCPQQEWKFWLLKAGLLPECDMGVSRTGLYTDFT